MSDLNHTLGFFCKTHLFEAFCCHSDSGKQRARWCQALASGSDPHPHRSLGCVEGAMADRRKRRQPLGSMPTARQQRRKRPCTAQEILTIVKAASECCTVRIEGWWVGVWMSGREQRLHYCCTAVWCPWLPLVHRLPLSAYCCLPTAPSHGRPQKAND